MVKKSVLVDKLHKFKKSSLNKGSFFSDQHLLKNQMSIEDLQKDVDDKEVVADKIGEASQEVAKQKSKKKKITSLITFLLNIAIVAAIFAFQLFNSEVQPFDELVREGHFKPQYILIILIAFAIGMMLETLRVTILLKKSTKRSRPFLCYKMISLGRYYDCVTPISTGGQPFQIFYLNKRGVDAGTAISIPIARYVIFQIAWTIISVFVTIYSSVAFGETNLVSVASYIGFILNLAMIIGVWVLSVSKKIGRLLVAKGLKLLCKMRIIKSYEKVYDKVMDTVNNFQSTMKTYTNNIKQFLLMTVSNIVQFLVHFSIPYFIYLLLGGAPDFGNFVTIWVYTILIELASGFVPLPGGSGMSEVAFTIVFANIFPHSGRNVFPLCLWFPLFCGIF